MSPIARSEPLDLESMPNSNGYTAANPASRSLRNWISTGRRLRFIRRICWNPTGLVAQVVLDCNWRRLVAPGPQFAGLAEVMVNGFRHKTCLPVRAPLCNRIDGIRVRCKKCLYRHGFRENRPPESDSPCSRSTPMLCPKMARCMILEASDAAIHVPADGLLGVDLPMNPVTMMAVFIYYRGELSFVSIL